MPGGRFGLSGGAGDVDGDGYADLLVCATTAMSAGDPGTAYVFRGSAAGLLPMPADSFAGQYGAVLGDVDGDGRSDVGVGSPDASGGNVAVYAFGPSRRALTRTTGPDMGGFGGAMARVGDLNGDGYADLLTGAQFAADGAGRAYEYLSTGSGFSRDATLTLTGTAGARFGGSVASAWGRPRVRRFAFVRFAGGAHGDR